MPKLERTVGYLLVASFFSMAAISQPATRQWHWVSAWSTALQTTRTAPGGLPPAAPFENQTIRMVVRPTIGGARLRIRLSNEFGAAPLAIGSAHVALVKENGTLVSGSDRPLKFNGELSVNIPAGSPMVTAKGKVP